MELDAKRVACFLDSLDPGNSQALDLLEKKALGDGIPIIRKSMQSLIRTLLAIKKPERILEIGTAVGFSALLMAENTPATSRITTIERYEKRILQARENFAKYDKAGRISLINADALLALKELADRGESYDFIFMDAAKGQYPVFFELVMRLLDMDGILLSDNVLQDGDVLESRFAVTRRDRTIHRRMRDYLYTICHDERLCTTILSIGDGAAVSVRRC